MADRHFNLDLNLDPVLRPFDWLFLPHGFWPRCVPVRDVLAYMTGSNVITDGMAAPMFRLAAVMLGQRRVTTIDYRLSRAVIKAALQRQFRDLAEIDLPYKRGVKGHVFQQQVRDMTGKIVKPRVNAYDDWVVKMEGKLGGKHVEVLPLSPDEIVEFRRARRAQAKPIVRVAMSVKL